MSAISSSIPKSSVSGSSSASWPTLDATRVRFPFVLVGCWLAMAAAALWWGLEYYVTPFQGRAFSTLHDTFKPAGVVGHAYGAGGSAMMVVGVVTYAARKRMSMLSGVGKLRSWLRFHIFLCTMGPFLVLLHTSFRFGGIVAIAFWSMTAVVVSGFFGRYVYAQIPKSINGQFLSVRTLERRQEQLLSAIQDRGHLTADEAKRLIGGPERRPPRGFLHAIWRAICFDLGYRRSRWRIRKALRARGVPKAKREALRTLVRERTRLDQQIALLQPFQRLFGYWHLFHLPLAIVMFVVMVVHIAVAVAFGYGWAF